MANKRRPVKQFAVTSLRDALLATEAGKALAVQAKVEREMIPTRIRTLKERVHSTFVSDVPRGRARRWDVYQASKAVCKALAVKGGEPYDEALEALKWVYTGKREYRTAIELITGSSK